MSLRSWLQRAGLALHAIRGSRSLAATGLLVLLLTLLSTAVGPQALSWLCLAALALLVIGLGTLAREGAAAQAAFEARAGDPSLPSRLARLLPVPLLLAGLLSPRIFLGAYGIPHLTPLTGLVLPAVQRQVGLVFLAVILLLPLLALRLARHAVGARPVPAPAALSPDDPLHGRRNVLLVCIVALVSVWLSLTRSFWAPFRLLAWPPELAALGDVAAAASISFTLIPAAVLFMLLALHGQLALAAMALEPGSTRRRVLALALLHAALALTAISLHVYDLLWVAQYQAGSNL